MQVSSRAVLWAVGCLCLLFALFPPATPAAAESVHGKFWIDQGQQMLHVWGTPYEMGYAHGYFLGPQILELMSVYTFPPEGFGTWLYDLARSFICNTFDFTDPELMDEVRGMLDGMIAGGVESYVEVLGRELDVLDLLTFNGLNDINALRCASLIGWGDATLADPELNGQPAFVHNSDFGDETREAPFLIAQRSLVISYTPSDPERQRFLTIGNPGTLGAAVALNESGVAVGLNLGMALNHNPDPDLDPKPTLEGWTSRQALSRRDADGDGAYTIEDYFLLLENTYQFGSTINHVIGPRAASDPPAAALEISNTARSMRYPADDPNLAPDIFMILNWEDVLVPERNEHNEERYQIAIDAILNTYQRNLTLANLWDFLYLMQVDNTGCKTMQSMVILPETGRFALAISDVDSLAPSKEPVWHDFAELFPPYAVSPSPAAAWIDLHPDDDDNDGDDDTVGDDDSAGNGTDDDTPGNPAPDDDEDDQDDRGGCI
ncbi:MAG: hypothetical protein GX444_01065 [Myxococcales bacterium]|nr:hypothetical protein [Myxococcales bacterium]